MAAAHVVLPALFRCATVTAWVGNDPMLFFWLFRPEALLVERQGVSDRGRPALYCPDVEPSLGAQLRMWFREGPDRSTSQEGLRERLAS